MKILTNLPGTLRVLFGFLRMMSVILAVFWLLALTFNSWIQDRVGHNAGLMVTVGEISLPPTPGVIGLRSDTATPGSLTLQALHGALLVDLCSNDPALVSALRWSVFPSMIVLVTFSFLVLTALRTVCANLERGQVFTDENLRLVRWIGIGLIAYSLTGACLDVWAAHVLGGYFGQHVVLTGLSAPLPFHGAPLQLPFLDRPAGLLTTWGGILVGCLVLLVAEAFRQGLSLKNENDLTI